MEGNPKPPPLNSAQPNNKLICFVLLQSYIDLKEKLNPTYVVDRLRKWLTPEQCDYILLSETRFNKNERLIEVLRTMDDELIHELVTIVKSTSTQQFLVNALTQSIQEHGSLLNKFPETHSNASNQAQDRTFTLNRNENAGNNNNSKLSAEPTSNCRISTSGSSNPFHMNLNPQNKGTEPTVETETSNSKPTTVNSGQVTDDVFPPPYVVDLDDDSSELLPMENQHSLESAEQNQVLLIAKRYIEEQKCCIAAVLVFLLVCLLFWAFPRSNTQEGKLNGSSVLPTQYFTTNVPGIYNTELEQVTVDFQSYLSQYSCNETQFLGHILDAKNGSQRLPFYPSHCDSQSTKNVTISGPITEEFLDLILSNSKNSLESLNFNNTSCDSFDFSSCPSIIHNLSPKFEHLSFKNTNGGCGSLYKYLRLCIKKDHNFLLSYSNSDIPDFASGSELCKLEHESGKAVRITSTTGVIECIQAEHIN